jgi:hypothetical protein
MESPQGDLVDVCKKIAQVAAVNAPDGWQELTIVRHMLFRLSEGKMWATLADGSRRSFGGGGAPLAKAFRELRDATLCPAKVLGSPQNSS